MKFSLPISTTNQLFGKEKSACSIRRIFLTRAAGIMLAVGATGCKVPLAGADAAPTATGTQHTQLSLAPTVNQPSLDQKITPTSSTAFLGGFTPPVITLPTGFCTFFPQLPPCDETASKNLPPRESEVTSFGSNPGNLKMLKYIPKNLGTARPLVVALHGCTQSATSYDDETGWTQLADKLHFALLLPQQDQTGRNNAFKCFRWFDSNHNQRGHGEALSIKQMIDTMVADTQLNIDGKQVYVTGLSAGGGMTAVMMASYPEMFAGGAPIAGIPYGCAQTGNDATTKCGVSLSGTSGTPASTPIEQLSATAWGDQVRNASPTPNGPFPRASIWQGTRDHVVNPQDETEMIKQWTDVLGVGQTPQVDEQLKTTRHEVFQDSSGRPMVEAFIVKDMDHGTPIDPGSANDQCGTTTHDQFIISTGICSSFFIAKFWGLAP